uniref:Uncharacterized protein n=1 Tax=Panagrolaimus sp. PS1159 TaxID=55785 RepID=A0AC35FIG7_9BILA
MKVSGSNEYVPWINVLKEVVNNGLIFPSRLPPCNSQNCINGKCQPLNECECFDGFEGIKCDRKISSFTKSLTTTTPTPETISTTSNINFDEITVATTSLDNITGTPHKNSVTPFPEVFETKNNNDSETVKSTTSCGIITTSATDVSTTFVTGTPEIASDITASTSIITTTTTSPSIITLIPKCPFSNYCSKVAKNGICDLRCNIAQCNFDNGDCIDKNISAVSDQKNVGNDYIQTSTSNSINFDEEKVKLKIVYEINPSNFDKTKATKFLDKFSQLSNIPNIHFSKTDSGDYEIYKWTENGGKGDLINLQSFSMTNGGGNLEGIEIYFDLDFGECKKSDTKCKFQNAKEVETRVIYPEEKKSSDGIVYVLIWVFLGIAVAMIFSVGVLERQTRKRNITAANSHLNEYPETSYKRRRYEAETYDGLYKLMRFQKTPESDLLEILQRYGSIETIKFLLKLDLTKKQRKTETNLIATLDDNGRTPLIYAIESEQWEAAKLLIENMKGLEFKAGIPALIVAKNCENEEIYKLIEANSSTT